MSNHFLADDLLRTRVRHKRVVETLLEAAGPELFASIESEPDLVSAWRAYEQLSSAHVNEIEAGVEDGPIHSQYDDAEAVLLGPSRTLTGALVRLLYGLRESICEKLDATGSVDVDIADYWDLVVWEALADLIRLGGIERLTQPNHRSGARHSLQAEKPSVIELPFGPTHQPLKDLFAYWKDKKGARIAPPQSAIRPEELPTTLLPHLALIDVVGELPRFRMRLFGTRLIMVYGEDITGRYLDEIDLCAVGPEILTYLTTMVRECHAQTVCAHLWKKASDRHIEYERIGLPLSEDGASVNMILCGFAGFKMWQ
jgi:hypothetical protein